MKSAAIYVQDGVLVIIDTDKPRSNWYKDVRITFRDGYIHVIATHIPTKFINHDPRWGADDAYSDELIKSVKSEYIIADEGRYVKKGFFGKRKITWVPGRKRVSEGWVELLSGSTTPEQTFWKTSLYRIKY